MSDESLSDLVSQGIPEPGSVTDKMRAYFARAGSEAAPNYPNQAGPSITLDMDNGFIHHFVQTGPVAITLDDANATSGVGTTILIIAVQDAVGGRALTFTNTIVWPTGTTPVFDTGANRANYIELSTTDGGVTWYGFLAGVGTGGGGGGSAAATTFAPAAGIAATNVQAAIVEDAGDLATHIGLATGAHAASATSFSPTAGIAATTVQAAIVEDAGDLAAHQVLATGAHAASAISVVPGSGVAATNVQAALVELQGEINVAGISAAIVDAKGDIIVATAADTVARKAAGTNGYALTYDSTQTDGLLARHPQGVAHEQNEQTGTSYTLVLTDIGKQIHMNNAAANTLTIPANASVAFPVGTVIPVFNKGAGVTTIAITTDTLNRQALAVTPVTINGQGCWAYLVKIAATTWQVFGDITTRVRTPVTLLVSDPGGSAITTGDGKLYWPVPAVLGGYDLVECNSFLTTASSSGLPTVQIANVTQAADMLTTPLSIDVSELTSRTAATAAVIDLGNDDVATGDMLRIDIDGAGTGAKGLIVELVFQ